MLRGAVWEHLNTRDLCDPDIVSSLSTRNTEYYDQLREKQQKKNVEGHHEGGTSRENMQQQQMKEMHKAMELAQKVRAQKETEERVMMSAYLPASTVSLLLRCICASFESEQNFAVYMEALFKASYNRNLRDSDIASDVTVTSDSSNSVKKMMVSRPKKIDYVQVRHALDFVEEPDIKRVVQVEHRTTTKVMGPYMHRSNKAKESL
jgi:hypothetical protein